MDADRPPDPSPAAGDPDPAGRLARLERSVSTLREEVARRDARLAELAEQLEVTRLQLVQTETELAKMATLFGAAAVPIVIADTAGTITEVNPEAERRYGRRRADLLGTSLADMAPPERRSHVEELLAQCRAGKTVRNAEGEMFDRAVDLESTLAVLTPLRDGGGEVTGIALTQDLRELERAKALLSQVNDDLRSVAAADELTQVANRRELKRRLAAEASRAMRHGETLSLAMIDIDHFKTYNDTFGHLAGDQCLREVVRVITGVVRRGTDVVARYGGEEFAVLLPSTPHSDAVALAEKIRAAVEQLHRREDSVLRRPVTVSIGLATTSVPRGFSPQHLVDAADRSLYRAKRDGRNLVRAARLTPRGARGEGPAAG